MYPPCLQLLPSISSPRARPIERDGSSVYRQDVFRRLEGFVSADKEQPALN
jgi:hypothetical protein